MTAHQAVSIPVWRTHFIEVYVFIAVNFVFCFAMGKWSKTLERPYIFSKGRE
ncbi:hypothetical protein [Pararhizobium sp. LjRoot238]|uniref:hypothetical protein n=1 Tax=Pararhizobium sp. LjRoot238 TaxID=3342293 RepID=UPI003ECDC4B0